MELIGGLDGAAGKFQFLNQGKVVEWLEDTLTPLTGSFSMGDSVASAATAVTVATGEGANLQPGHILMTGSQFLWVSAVSSDTLTVTRGFGQAAGASASADITSTATYTIVGMARLEGDDSDAIGFTDVTSNSNYTQIFHKEIKMSGTELVIDNYGMGDPYQYQASKSIPELMRLVERSLQWGYRAAGSTTTPRVMGGYNTFITTNLGSGASAATVALIEDTLQLAYEAGAAGEFAAVISPANYQIVKNLYDSSAYVRYAPEQNRFGTLVDKIVTPFGNVSFTIDRWQRDKRIPFLNLANIGMLTLRPWQVEDLAKDGDAIKTQLIGEFTLCVKLDKSHAMMTSA